MRGNRQYGCAREGVAAGERVGLRRAQEKGARPGSDALPKIWARMKIQNCWMRQLTLRARALGRKSATWRFGVWINFRLYRAFIAVDASGEQSGARQGLSPYPVPVPTGVMTKPQRKKR